MLKNPYLGMHRGGGGAMGLRRRTAPGGRWAVPAAAPQFDNGESAILQ